jgi:hypothetical protein
MENGARGASFNPVELCSYPAFAREQVMESHSHLLCDVITSSEIEEKIRSSDAVIDLFNKGRSCLLKTFDVEIPSVLRWG